MALLAAVLAGCGGGTGGTSAGTGGGGPSWHRTIVGDSFPVPDASDLLSEGCVALEASGAGTTYAAYADQNQYDPLMRGWDGVSWTGQGGTPRAVSYFYGCVMAAARTDAGEPVLIWPEQPVSQEAAIHAARYSGGAWIAMGDPVAIGTTSAIGEIHAVPAAGGPLMSWTIWEAATNVVHVARWSGSGWVELGTPRIGLKYGFFALAASPGGDPVAAYAAPDGSAVVERWSSSTLAWTATPSLGITSATAVAVGVDGAGALYAAVPKVAPSALPSVSVDAVWRLAPGAGAWSTLGLPPGFTTATSRMTLLGLPATGGGVVAAWIQGGARIARYTGGAWETVYAPTAPEYSQTRPMLSATSANDLWFGYVSSMYVPSMVVWRLQKY